MTYYLESAALRSSPLKILREQLRSFFAATMAEKKPHQEVLINQETINQQAERLLTDYGNNVLRLAYAYLHNMNDAEEILQDTLIQFLKTAPTLDSPKHEKAWLLRVAANLSKNRIDYNQRRLADELNEELVAEERGDLSFVCATDKYFFKAEKRTALEGIISSRAMRSNTCCRISGVTLIFSIISSYAFPKIIRLLQHAL